MERIRLVAVDEDGTFLRDHHTYDTERFERLWRRMREQEVRFVVATGNQCYQVQDLFPAHARKMGIVSANGAYVLDGDVEVFAARASNEARALMTRACRESPDVPFSMLGVQSAYVERSAPQAFFDDMATYCHRQRWVDDFADVDDQVFMFSSVVDEAVVEEQVARFSHLMGDLMDVVGSGEGYFDVVCPGVSKASGLSRLLDRWNIKPEECVAFGDSDNDLAMLELVGCGYAMENASDAVKARADRVAPSCAEDGVLQVLEELLG